MPKPGEVPPVMGAEAPSKDDMAVMAHGSCDGCVLSDHGPDQPSTTPVSACEKPPTGCVTETAMPNDGIRDSHATMACETVLRRYAR